VLFLVYTAGAVARIDDVSVGQFGKGLAKFSLHFAFLCAGVAYLVRRPTRSYWITLATFCAGMGVSAVYAGLQLAAVKTGFNLDAAVLSPLNGREARTLLYTGGLGPRIDRVRGLTTDPNHLAIMLLVPLLVLTPLAVDVGRRLSTALRRGLGVFLAVCLMVFLATFSRSALLGLGAGLLVLLAAYRRRLFSKPLLLPAAAAVAIVAVEAALHWSHLWRVLSSRTHTAGEGDPGHFEIYDYVPRTFDTHPLLGIGLNNFAPYFAPLTGKSDYGPLSFYVQSLTETGVVGTAVFAVFLACLCARLRALLRQGRTSTDDADARTALGWGLVAALAGTLVANGFYLTMTFAYFYVFMSLAFAAPLVFAAARSGAPVELSERRREQLGEAGRGVLAGDVVPSTPPHL
jgi:O-antigen ligase